MYLAVRCQQTCWKYVFKNHLAGRHPPSSCCIIHFFEYYKVLISIRTRTNEVKWFYSQRQGFFVIWINIHFPTTLTSLFILTSSFISCTNVTCSLILFRISKVLVYSHYSVIFKPQGLKRQRPFYYLKRFIGPAILRRWSATKTELNSTIC